MDMTKGCTEAKDPAIRQWTRFHEEDHVDMEKKLEKMCHTIRWHSKVVWCLTGALGVLLFLISRNPDVIKWIFSGG